MRNKAPAKSVDAYLAALPLAEKAALQKLRKTIKAAAPMAEEGISYGMPGYKYLGPLVYFAAFQDHCSFFGGNKTILSRFSAELKSFEIKNSTLHFSPQKPVPAAVIKKIVRARMLQNEERMIQKRKS